MDSQKKIGSSDKGGKMKKIALLTMFVVVALFLFGNVQGAITVIDFEELATPGTGATFISQYEVAGFKFTAEAGASAAFLRFFHTEHESFAGSTAIHGELFGASPPDVILGRTDSLTFDLLSIDISERWPQAIPSPITIVGMKDDGSTVSTTVSLDGVFGFETFELSGFTDLVSLRLFGTTAQYSNFVVSIIPEPASLLLLGLGGLLIRRKK